MFTEIGNTIRIWQAARVLSRHDALFPAEYTSMLPPWVRVLRRILGGRQRNNDAASPGVRLARALESLGPAYIKLGQILATRPDVVGSATAKALEDLQDRLPPFATDEAKRSVEASLGTSLADLFFSFGDPIAAASIAQVHLAETSDSRGETPNTSLSCWRVRR